MKHPIFIAALLSSVLGFSEQLPILTDTSKITPIAGPRVEEGADVFLTADLIYWDAVQSGLGFLETIPTGLDDAVGQVYYPDFNFDAGFQLGLGLQLGHDGWDITTNYTWFHPELRTQPFVDDNLSLRYAQLGNPSSSYVQGKCDFSMELDVIDFSIGRNYFISEFTTLRPFAGLKVVWNEQKISQVFDDTIDNLFTIKNTQKAFGMGLRSGMDTFFKFNENWSLYSTLAFDVLSYRVKNYLKGSDETTPSASILVQSEDSQLVILPITEMSFGVLWDIWSDNEEYHLGVSGGYDFQYWNNHLYTIIPIFSDTSGELDKLMRKSGNLSIQGINIRFRFDF